MSIPLSSSLVALSFFLLLPSMTRPFAAAQQDAEQDVVDCAQLMHGKHNRYHIVLITSLLCLTFFTMIASFCCQRRFASQPGSAVKCYVLLGLSKCLLAIVLLTMVTQPMCQSDLFCCHYDKLNIIYPLALTLLGLYWLSQVCHYRKIQQRQQKSKSQLSVDALYIWSVESDDEDSSQSSLTSV
jgi:hypothetical protein